ncbi:helix-turn-helix domain-containing protein [Flagellimonas nanhaiensis]|uniref:AraC family transcriptional regulator n=1 Tax=Flagellimonas nanhaiensis TaxID=2292706 RepID=A0A371JP65_9FLAO|nr:helix-turn-helix domain-containing protein [Allomuricauda nanhaiensis]RDY59314.1 AraC family transcriptional regulator [Allomuricauda nanhaiensis]
MTTWEIILLFLGFQALLLSFLFFFKRSNSFNYANRLFSLFLFLCGWSIIYNTLYWSKKLYEPSFIHLNFTYVIPMSLIGPIFFFYIRNSTNGIRISLQRDIIHFVPFLFIVLKYSPYYFLSSSMKLAAVGNKSLLNFIQPSDWYEIGLVLLMAIYGIYIMIKYTKYFGNDADLKLWTRAITFGYLGCALSFIVFYALLLTGILTTEQDYHITLFLCISVLISAYFAFNFPAIFYGKSLGEIVPFIKYKKTGLSESYSNELKENLLDHMLKEKPFLNRELRLDDLADALGIGRHHASQIINAHFCTNFFDFINLYRVEEAIRLLEEKGSALNLAEIGFLSGFNNTVSFNKAFKKNTGVTPSKFRKEIMSDNL